MKNAGNLSVTIEAYFALLYSNRLTNENDESIGVVKMDIKELGESRQNFVLLGKGDLRTYRKIKVEVLSINGRNLIENPDPSVPQYSLEELYSLLYGHAPP